ncbi:MAG: hypothetical protein ABI887_03075, partial [Burkholderiales bacterium]
MAVPASETAHDALPVRHVAIDLDEFEAYRHALPLGALLGVNPHRRLARASRIAGTCGSSGDRLSDVMASAFSEPLSTCCNASLIGRNM